MHALDTKMPFKVLFRTPPNLLVAHLWGCKVWVHDDTGSKLDACTRKGQWLGFNVDSCYDPQTCRAPIFYFPLCPLSLLTHLGPLPLPIYSTDPLMRTIPTDLYHI